MARIEELNGHLRFEHEYPLDQARRVAAGIHVDGALASGRGST